MKEQLVKKETALAAKEKGFDWECMFQTDDKGSIYAGYESNNNLDNNRVCLPTQSLLQKWLREKHKIDVIPTMSEFSRTYGYKVYYVKDGRTHVNNQMFTKYETYEQALEVGLQEALKLIEK